MKLKISDYQIESDGTCFTMSKTMQPKDPNKPEYQKTIGHYSKLQHAFDALPDRALMLSDAIGFRQVCDELKRYADIVSKIDLGGEK